MPSGPRITILVWMVLVLPAVYMLQVYWRSADAWPADMIAPTGEWSARLIILALSLTPLLRLFPRSAIVRWLVKHRRAIGVAAFCYALLHLGFYVADMGTLQLMLAEIGAPAIWTGWLAFLCLLLPALTSNDAAMRALRSGWKRIQRFAYAAAILTLVHWLLVHDGKLEAVLHFAPLLLLQLLRLLRSFQSPPSKGNRMKLPLTLLAAALAAAAAASPASATGKMTCDAPKAQWKSMTALQAQLKKQGWQVRKAKVDGGCYEVYGTDPKGNRVEAYFHPVSFKKLLVSRRGQVLFRAK